MKHGSYGFSDRHVWMWELDHKEGQASENWYFWIVVIEKTLESPLDSKEIKQVNPTGNQPWILVTGTDAEVVAPILWPPDAKSRLTGKEPDVRKDWRQEKKGVQRMRWSSPTQWIWVWENSRRQGRTGKPGMLQSNKQTNLATEQQHGNFQNRNW